MYDWCIWYSKQCFCFLFFWLWLYPAINSCRQRWLSLSQSQSLSLSHSPALTPHLILHTLAVKFSLKQPISSVFHFPGIGGAYRRALFIHSVIPSLWYSGNKNKNTKLNFTFHSGWEVLAGAECWQSTFVHRGERNDSILFAVICLLELTINCWISNVLFSISFVLFFSVFVYWFLCFCFIFLIQCIWMNKIQFVYVIRVILAFERVINTTFQIAAVFIKK